MRPLLRFLLISLGTSCCWLSAHAQCPNNNALTFVSPVDMTPAGVGQTVINSQVWGGEYVTVNVSTGNNYTFSTCTGNSYDTYLTIYRESNGVAMGFNDNFCSTQSRIVWTATFSGVLRVLIDQGAACGSNTTNTDIRVTLNSVFPVEWLGFEGEALAESVRLDWETARELDAARFFIERSQDGQNFSRIGEVPAQGNSEKGQAYTFTDAAPMPGTNYYRLGEISMNGEESRHDKTLRLHMAVADGIYGLQVYPSPAWNRAQLRAQVHPEQPLSIQVLDMLGREIRQWEVATPASNFDFGLDLDGLESGQYLVSLRQGNSVLHHKIVLMGE